MAAGRSGFVLVVEDDLLLMRLICELLDLHGFKSLGAATHGEALRVAAGERPAIFLIDLMLPELSGVDLARRLRASAFREAPMIAMSVSTEMMREAARSGAFQAVLAKPFEVAELIGTIAESLPQG